MSEQFTTLPAADQQHALAIQAELPFFMDIRHQIHQQPELGFEEQVTSDKIASLLKEWGYEVHQGLAKTGVVGTLKVGTGTKVLGLRADMDALPIQENSQKPWQSKIDGKFHGCGHDGHTTILLAAAKRLAQTKNFNGTLRVIFQPAEELLYGGRVMLEDGLFDLFPCDAIFALHNMPKLKVGEFYFHPDAMMASSDTLHIHIEGVGSHGALPDLGIDAAVVACYIVVALQSIVARNVNPFAQAVITVGHIGSGEAPNVVNGNALLKLSVRALNSQVRHLLLKRIEEIADNQAKSFGATARVEHINGCPPLINGKQATEFAIQVATSVFGEAKVHTDLMAVMGSEDFAYMLEANPNGNYCFVGNGDGESACMVHNPHYDFNDDIILPAATYWCALTERYLA